MNDMRTGMFWSIAASILCLLPKSFLVFAIDECWAGNTVNDVKRTSNTSLGEKLPWREDETVKMDEIWNMLDCDGVFRKERPIHNASTWAMMRGAYVAAVGIEKSSLKTQTIFDGSNGFEEGSVVIKQSPNGKGRTVYAARRFKKGELVWKEDFSACFDDGLEYRRFLASLPSHLTCDIFLWAYTASSFGVCVDLDEGSFINHASIDKKKKLGFEKIQEQPNVLHREEMEGQVAIRDIEIGEEILTDYNDFEEPDAWDLLNLGNWEPDPYDSYAEDNGDDEEDSSDDED